jgi:hypothetical protein
LERLSRASPPVFVFAALARLHLHPLEKAGREVCRVPLAVRRVTRSFGSRHPDLEAVVFDGELEVVDVVVADLHAHVVGGLGDELVFVAVEPSVHGTHEARGEELLVGGAVGGGDGGGWVVPCDRGGREQTQEENPQPRQPHESVLTGTTPYLCCVGRIRDTGVDVCDVRSSWNAARRSGER